MEHLHEIDWNVGLTSLNAAAQAEKPVFEAKHAQRLQKAVENLFGYKGFILQDLSLTIADPSLESCPLVACSTGFTKLCGYHMTEIVGRSCRFLVEPVPKELVSSTVNRLAREFCESAAAPWEFRLKAEDRRPWMPENCLSDDGIFLVQRNARKDGTLFCCMFYLRHVQLNDHPFIIGLQAALPLPLEVLSGQHVQVKQLEVAHEACRKLKRHMAEVEQMLGSMFWYAGPMTRQDADELQDDGFKSQAGLRISSSELRDLTELPVKAESMFESIKWMRAMRKRLPNFDRRSPAADSCRIPLVGAWDV